MHLEDSVSTGVHDVFAVNNCMPEQAVAKMTLAHPDSTTRWIKTDTRDTKAPSTRGATRPPTANDHTPEAHVQREIGGISNSTKTQRMMALN